MQPSPPSDADLAVLAQAVDDQLLALHAHAASGIHRRGPASDNGAELPAAPDQQALIERTTGEPFETFWAKYQRHARRDLCLPGGLLHTQWQKWRDLQSKDAVKMSLAALAGSGIPTASLGPVAVAATVFLLNVLAKIGIEAVCEGCAEEEAARARKAATDEHPGSQ